MLSNIFLERIAAKQPIQMFDRKRKNITEWKSIKFKRQTQPTISPSGIKEALRFHTKLLFYFVFECDVFALYLCVSVCVLVCICLASVYVYCVCFSVYMFCVCICVLCVFCAHLCVVFVYVCVLYVSGCMEEALLVCCRASKFSYPKKWIPNPFGEFI